MKLSKGASHIEQILKANKIEYKLEYCFKDLLGHTGQLLRFDFAIFEKGKLIALLEYDSDLHFIFSPMFHKTRTNFKAAQQRDRTKNSYCLAHKIPLYRIPYWEVEKINTYSQLFNQNFLVKNKFHNDYLTPKK